MTEIIKGVGTLHTPIYAIYGQERRKLKKEYNLLKSFVKSSPSLVSVNNDLYKIYGEPEKIISKERQDEVIEKAKSEMTEIKERLDKLYEPC